MTQTMRTSRILLRRSPQLMKASFLCLMLLIRVRISRIRTNLQPTIRMRRDGLLQPGTATYPLPVADAAWFGWAVGNATEEELDAMIQVGQKHAMQWLAREVATRTESPLRHVR